LRRSGVVDLVRFVLLFPVSVLTGCILGGFSSVLQQTAFGGREFSLRLALMIGVSYTIFATIPAIVFGVPAVLLLRRRQSTKITATLALTGGGAIVGWLLMTVTFTGFEVWGALTGASVGFMLGVLLVPYSKAKSADG
jgi:membrane associated rhomboid family serine protease